MNSEIEALKKKRDVKGLVGLLSSSDHVEAADALVEIDDPVVIAPLVDFLQRKEDYIASEVARYTQLWRTHPTYSNMDPQQQAQEARVAACSNYLGIQLRAIRIFEKLGGAKAAAHLKRMAASDPDADVREDAATTLARLGTT